MTQAINWPKLRNYAKGQVRRAFKRRRVRWTDSYDDAVQDVITWALELLQEDDSLDPPIAVLRAVDQLRRLPVEQGGTTGDPSFWDGLQTTEDSDRWYLTAGLRRSAVPANAL